MYEIGFLRKVFSETAGQKLTVDFVVFALPDGNALEILFPELLE
jgi:hypothetical protein